MLSPPAYSKHSLIVLAFAALAWSFWFSHGWLVLCAGLALFLFGMQNLEQGLKSLAGGKLEGWLSQSTATPFKGLLFGTAATFVLQSSTLVSLLTIAFLSAGLITLAGSIAVLFGANLGATSGIWLLAMAGQNLSMAPLAMPLLVFGVLLGFAGDKGKAIGRFLLGISLIFLGIDEIKQGFSSFGDLQLNRYSAEGVRGALLFVGVGTLITVVLQSSHATLMLTLAALANQQLELPQALAIAIGSNVGSAVSTAVMGMIGSARPGQRLAVAHVVFNCTTAVIAFLLLAPMTWGVQQTAAAVGLGDNPLIQLAMFHTLFNVMGVLVFWPLQRQLARALERWLPDLQEPEVLIATHTEQVAQTTRARYLQPAALQSVESACSAVSKELQHMGRLGLEVVAHALYAPVQSLQAPLEREDPELRLRLQQQAINADVLYKTHIKGVYADLLEFMGSMVLPMDGAQQDYWHNSQVAAFQLVEAVKDAHRLQRNMYHYLQGPDDAPARSSYLELRLHMLQTLRDMRMLSVSDMPEPEWAAQLQAMDERIAAFDAQFRKHLFAAIRGGLLDSLTVSSLMNDLGFSHSIIQGLRHVLLLGEGHEAARQQQLLMGEAPLIQAA
ncbi:Na/Pi cotransporter family protein [Comamonas aquatica]|uniref:Na/Pi-cotransporter II-related protein n=1 Tax=Comamonas aquatica TaxID=225991 RepID=A0AA35D8B2_9BURK|nr:Na/Pi symporter [Comamonas aquatica]CAB5679647.1 Na/Pi-cotransporter II-related protein [Comamonas aquatica]CAB5699239.1 Na/Pi-cotransporter II-related protein [Comamonas aquatica]CAC9197293.1 Na/Pi-cotransporter II-related protein [Comamonas aquatica]CAC9689649.1 Na/Pi-cotransporter II-related protein [Comamonas aquatica]